MEIRVTVINKVMRSSWHCVDVYLFQQDFRGKSTETIDSKLISRLKPGRNHNTLAITVKNSNFIHTGCILFHTVLGTNSSIRLISEMETEFFLRRVGTPPHFRYMYKHVWPSGESLTYFVALLWDQIGQTWFNISFIHSLVFSLRGRAGRNQSPVMWSVWLWHTASWASSWG